MTGPPTDVRVTSRTNPRVRSAAALRDRRARDERGLTLVDGAREVSRAIAAGVDVEEAFVCEELATTIEARRAVDAVRRSASTAIDVTPNVFERLAFGDRSDGVVAVVRPPSTALADLAPRLPPDPLLVVLESVEKPGNLGAVLRSADGAGAAGVIVADPRTDLWNPNAIRASLGTIFSVPVAAGSSGDVIAWLREHGARIVAARVDASVAYTSADLTGAVAIVLGSEAEGLTTTWDRPDVIAVRLPMLGAADSLNVSTAAAVLLYESRRQRDAPNADGSVTIGAEGS